MRPLYEYTLDALRQMVGISDITQREMLEKNSGMSYPQFVEEFCVVHLRGPRGCGHTSALIELAKERFINWVVLITPDPRHFSIAVQNRIRQMWGPRNRISVVRSADGIRERFVWTPGSIDAVMIDNANYWNDGQLKRIQIDTGHLAHHKIEKKEPFFYIYVQ